MASISALGIGSGLDLNGLLDQLNAAERQKLGGITQQKKSYQTKLSAYGQLESALSKFQTAAAKLGDAKIYDSVKSSVTGEALSAASGQAAALGHYAIDVTQLARAHSVATVGVEDKTAALGAGTVSFTQANGESFSVTLEAGKSSLEDLRNAINKADGGVRASIVNDGSGTPYRLALHAVDTGSEATLSNVDFGALSGALTLDAATEVLALDAELNINGIAVTSQSNIVEEAIEGVTLSLKEEGEAILNVNRDSGAIEAAVKEFVSAYNALQKNVDVLSDYNQDTGQGGTLLGDSVLRSVQSRLRSIMTGGVAEGEFKLLSDLGISLQLDGTLKADEDKLKDLVADDLASLSSFFAGSGGGKGLGDLVEDGLKDMLRSNGLLFNAKAGLESSIERADERYTRMEASIDTLMGRYRSQFAKLDGMVASMNSTSNYLAQQFDMMNAQLGRKK